jgi:hypothetical protein
VAPRLLVIADPKMLPALSSGLRDGGRFEVVPQPIADLTAAQTHAAQSDAVAVFYGTSERPLVAALQQISPAVRERGARVVAVLQKEQAPLRDDCFRAGASDVLFMPLPKDQFVSRLTDIVGLAFSGEGGQGAQQATVSTRTLVHPLEAAAVVAAGVLAPVGPELKAGETVRLAWTGAGAQFTSWGLVVRSDAQGARVRVAGMTPPEETRFKEWLAGAKVPPVAPPPSWATAATISESKIYPPTIAETPALVAPQASADAPAPARAATPPALAALAPTPPVTTEAPAPAAPLPAAEAPAAAPEPAVPAAAPSPSEAAAQAVSDLAQTQPSAPLIASTVPTLPSFPAAPVSSGNSNPGVKIPVGGPPPGFAARPPIRPQSPRTASRPGAPPMMVPTSTPGNPTPPATTSSPGLAKVAAPSGPPGKGTTSPGTPAPKIPSITGAQAPVLPASGAPAVKFPSASGVQAPVLAPPAPAPSTNGVEANGAAPAPAAAPANGGLDALFDDVGAGSGPAAPAAAPAPAEAPAGPVGPSWPASFDPAVYKGWLAVMLRERNLPAEAGPELAAAFLKVCGGLSSGEREGLEKAGPESPFHEALVARAVLAFAGAAGTKLAGAQPPPAIDQEHVTAVTQFADAAGKRLQSEADRAIGKGEVETLQMVTAASGPLSREQLAFKEVLDRLRGLGAAPRLGAGALDPDMQVPGQAPRVPGRAVQQAEQAKRAELKDFEAFRNEPTQKSRKRTLLVLAGVLGLAALNVLVFSAMSIREAPNSLVETAGVGVLQVQLGETSALVRVTKTWFNSPNRPANLRRLCEALVPTKLPKALIVLENGGMVGYVEVAGCKPVGLGPVPVALPPK